MRETTQMNEIYLAGGCFWGLEEAFRDVTGIVSTECGYANGDCRYVPDYMMVCSGKFGYKEAVRLVYDPEVLSLDAILHAFFGLIHPEQEDGQGNDIGVQYHTGVYWTDPGSERTVLDFFAEEAQRHGEFHTEAGPLTFYSPAETNHQKYLMRNPAGYCHINREQMSAVRRELEESPRPNASQ